MGGHGGRPGQTTGGGYCAVLFLCLLAAQLLLFITGCTTPTVTKTQTVEVKVPVAVQPIRADQVPAVPAPLPKRPESPSAALDVLLSKWCEAVGYFIQADPLLRISAGGKPGAVALYPECEQGVVNKGKQLRLNDR